MAEVEVDDEGGSPTDTLVSMASTGDSVGATFAPVVGVSIGTETEVRVDSGMAVTVSVTVDVAWIVVVGSTDGVGSRVMVL